MKKTRKSIYLRYEFTNEKGIREGGDIFEYNSLSEAEAMIGEILKVTLSDGVAVNITLGESKPFIGFLTNAGLTQEQIDAERVELETTAASKKSSQKKYSKKKTRKK
jgi:hypothetical protein